MSVGAHFILHPVTEVALEVEEEERMRQASCRQTQQSPVTFLSIVCMSV